MIEFNKIYKDLVSFCFLGDNMNPNDRKYYKEHTWAKFEGNIAVVGITDFAQKQLKDVVYIELPAVGKQVKQGENLGVIESVKSVSDVFSPVSGEIIEVNKELEKDPTVINKNAYGTWIAKIKLKEKDDKLMNAEEYEKSIS